ncbi:MAG: type II secretion system F family protein [Deltaproteobacteria bacterium]|nr:type II secretion system F family protein [Deltaproteobacteria bacterium]
MLLLALAQALEAGLSLRQLVHDPATAGLVPANKRALVRGVVDAGGSLADALADAHLVDDAGAAVIAAGERGGFLPAALRTVAADVLERRQRRRRLALALAYPALLVLLASVILPLPLLVTAGAGAYLARAAPGVVMVVVVLVGGFALATRLPARAKAAVLGVCARVPLLGAIVVDDTRAAMLRLLGRLLAAGVPARGALASSLAASGLANLGQRADEGARALDGGRTIAEALVETEVVDDALGARVALAERTGDLDTALPRLAVELKERAARRVVMLTIATGMFAFLVVAVGIARALVVQTQATYDAIDRATAE